MDPYKEMSNKNICHEQVKSFDVNMAERPSLRSSKLETVSIEHLVEKVEVTKDAFFGVHIMFFFLGLVNYIPYTFFVTATDYWMYKFRNTTTNDMDSQSRTILQRQFASTSAICTNICTVTCSTLFTIFGHKVKLTTRIIAPILIVGILFIFFTSFIKVDTDTWQLEFFILTMVTIGIINSFNVILELSIYGLAGKFPHSFFTPFLIGQGVAGIFNSIIQISALAIGASRDASALIYFITGSSVIIFTLTLFIAATRYKCYQFYVYALHEDTQRNVLTIPEIKEILKKIWPHIIINGILLLNVALTTPAITSLVVSENEGKSVWADAYFVPVVTFLLYNMCAVIGRFLGSHIKPMGGTFLIVLGCAKTLVFTPLIMLCNARPRHHLPVVLNQDFEYIIVIITDALLAGFLFNQAMINVARAIPKTDIERAFSVLAVCVGIMNAAFTTLGPVFVELL